MYNPQYDEKLIPNKFFKKIVKYTKQKLTKIKVRVGQKISKKLGPKKKKSNFK